jgi:hypothetical protein
MTCAFFLHRDHYGKANESDNRFPDKGFSIMAFAIAEYLVGFINLIPKVLFTREMNRKCGCSFLYNFPY